jgi:hypothetical protein
MRKKQKTGMECLSDLLILPDGRIFVQNLTQPMAELLHGLNPKDKTITLRTKKSGTIYDLPNRA